MSQRFHWAIMSCDMNDLIGLARLLSGAVQESAAEGSLPHMDPAVRLISHSIAMAGNGDLPFHYLYEKMYEYCSVKAGQGPNFEYQDNLPEIQPPEYKVN